MMFSIRTCSTVGYASGLFIVEDVESNEPHVFRLGVYQFPENKFQLRLQRIHREEPFSSRLSMIKGSTLAWTNERLGYTVSVSLSGRLTPLRPMERRDDSAYHLFAFVYRASVRLEPIRLMSYDRLLDNTQWFSGV